MNLQNHVTPRQAEFHSIGHLTVQHIIGRRYRLSSTLAAAICELAGLRGGLVSV